MYYNSGSECIDLATKRSVHSLRCDQNEADTKMFFYASVLSSENSISACIIDSEDSDVYVIASKASHEILAPLLIYRNGKYYHCKELCPKEILPYITQI